MGKQVVRKTDVSTGHPPCFPPTNPIKASPDVFANGIAIVRMGDKYKPHTCSGSTHQGTAMSASKNVFVNGKKITRTTDPISCGDKAGVGSSDVFAG